VDELTAVYVKKYGEIERSIRRVGDDVLEEVLELRYLQYMKWEDIAQRMNYSERQTTRLHGIALEKMQKLLKMSPNVLECPT
jgi:DNA-directed RNA polymerase specialized sigma subunit